MSGLKKLIAVVGIAACLSSYYALAAYSANHAAATEIMVNAKVLYANWKRITLALRIDPRTTKEGALSPVLVKNHSALDWLIYGEHVMAEPYKEGFKMLKVAPILDDIHVSNLKGKIIYTVSGAKLNSISVLDDGTMAVFYSNLHRPIIEALLDAYDSKPFSLTGDDTGIIRYGAMGDDTYAMGVYFSL